MIGKLGGNRPELSVLAQVRQPKCVSFHMFSLAKLGDNG